MSRWQTTSELEAGVDAARVWRDAYLDAGAWPRWNAEIKRASLDGPLALGARARIVFGTGLRLRFEVIEYEEGRLFTDETRLPGARMGHRHLVEPAGSRFFTTPRRGNLPLNVSRACCRKDIQRGESLLPRGRIDVTTLHAQETRHW